MEKIFLVYVLKKQVNLCDFEVSLVYCMSSMIAGVTQSIPFSKIPVVIYYK